MHFYRHINSIACCAGCRVDKERNKRLVFLTNNSEVSAETVAGWQVELFFKWIKQHLRIKSFIGTSVNSVKSQLWVALSIYLLVAGCTPVWLIIQPATETSEIL
jgi:carbon starvation protein CstA